MFPATHLLRSMIRLLFSWSILFAVIIFIQVFELSVFNFHLNEHLDMRPLLFQSHSFNREEDKIMALGDIEEINNMVTAHAVNLTSNTQGIEFKEKYLLNCVIYHRMKGEYIEFDCPEITVSFFSVTYGIVKNGTDTEQFPGRRKNYNAF